MYVERGSRVAGAVVWSREAAHGGGEARVLPDGCMDLLLWDGEPFIAGPDTRAHLVTDRRGLRITGLRLPPGTGPRVFGVRAHELRDQRVPLGAVWAAPAVRELMDRAGGARDPGAVLEEVAALRLAEERAVAKDPHGVPVVEEIVAALRAGASVAATARRAGLSERQLHRRCLDAFGYGAKTLARVLRMRGALRLARDRTPLSETAARAGYADQAHLAREIKALAGVPMTELIRPSS
ncbi:helix-turn-helix transcriptional regulator [Streptomyces iconiensis]|uniref:Helix-turn-helix transcriptional regulator n=1 Tax=Streptomyces iconiensis TaxID=1384038 RepID=A0ABT6ZPC0_9ACTN|nr:helix-turn-helix transcriptional regulator [Streptomyces iconiensis]MDJ1130511.1 helix-turn-helix transcriptional regulator [Streptomyces iconiensis]